MTYETSPSMFFVDFDCQKDLLSFIVLSLLICSNEICLLSFWVHNFNYRKTEKQFPLCVIFTLKYFNYKTHLQVKITFYNKVFIYDFKYLSMSIWSDFFEDIYSILIKFGIYVIEMSYKISYTIAFLYSKKISIR